MAAIPSLDDFRSWRDGIPPPAALSILGSFQPVDGSVTLTLAHDSISFGYGEYYFVDGATGRSSWATRIRITTEAVRQ
jgi:hypothetical protein